VQRARLLFGFVWLCGGCGHAESRPPAVAAPAQAATPAPTPPRAPATGCRAEPSTVYGAEPVVFAIDAASPTQVDVELLDASGRSVARDTVPAPGTYRPLALPSGDFELGLGEAPLRCHVTVNRELSRASQAKR
jgi:hypothetical protein